MVRPVNTRHRWDETCLQDIIVIKSMFEISGNNFNDWFRQLKMVLRVERKLFVIEQPISLASPTDSEYLCSGMRYMIHNEVACLMLGSKSSSPAVQQLWTLYPGKQTANLMTNTQTPPPATTVVIPTGAPATNTVANHAERPEKFNGQNFKRWQQKMFFYLTTLGLARFLKETAPQVEPPAEGQSSNAQAVQAVEAWKHSDFLCHNYVLNGLIDPIFLE
ncbi:hypothetical protein Tco_0054155 [Tanacetum coccineum]